MRKLFNLLWRRIWLVLLFSISIIVALLIWSGAPTQGQPQALTIKIAAISAFFSAVGSFATLAQALQAQREIEEAQRPSVLAYFDLSSQGAIHLHVENVGNSPAAEVELSFSEPIKSGLGGMSLGFLDNPISFLPPGGSVRQYFGHAHSILYKNDPRTFEAKLKYQSTDGRIFHEVFKLDLDYFRQIRYPEMTIQESLKAIADAIQRSSTRDGPVSSLFAPPTTESSLASIASTLKKLIPQTDDDTDEDDDN